MKGIVPSKKKVPFNISSEFHEYLHEFERITDLPISYDDMGRHMATIPILDKQGNDTLWSTLIYDERESIEINEQCCKIYALLKTDGDMKVIEHLQVARIDFCHFGNTNPYRVRIINQLNDNYDHFYIKRIDSSRVYGLELESLLSPNRVVYIYNQETLIEEHIAGIPGDDFIKNHLAVGENDETRIAKEFIKFNERCFVRLLGDMRAYNYIVDITPDIEGNQYRIRAIDFDQQSYEGRKNFYLPQFFKGNNDIIQLGFKHLDRKTVAQYQLEERSLIARRAKTSRFRLNKLLKCMISDQISTPAKVEQLASELNEHHNSAIFTGCESMGEVVLRSIQLVIQKEFKQGIIDLDLLKN